jgi:tRNA(fMet)-specific endonuclease VapC
MKVLDTDTLTLLFQGHESVLQRHREEREQVAIAVVSRIEVLQGRFASLFKAADGLQLKRGQQRLDQAERDLRPFPVLPIDNVVADEFDRLRNLKGAKKMGRPDLLIAAIVLANRTTLVTRNVKDFRQLVGIRVENWAD